MAIRANGWRITLLPDKEIRAIYQRDDGVRDDLENRMQRVNRAAKTIVGVDTGKLQSSIRNNTGYNSRGVYVDTIAGWSGRGLGKSYVMYHHDGTAPHVIMARRRKALRYMQNGKVVFRKKVKHPGTRGTRFLVRALPFAGGL